MNFSILIWLILDLLMYLRVIDIGVKNKRNIFLQAVTRYSIRIRDSIERIAEPFLFAPIRKFLPKNLPFDLAPLIVLLATHFLEYTIEYYFRIY